MNHWSYRLLIAFWIAVAAALVFLLVSAQGAPAPLPRRSRAEPPAVGAGLWRMSWGGSDWSVTLTGGPRQGDYRAAGASVEYHGYWSLEGRTLSVGESIDDVTWLVWELDLDGGLSGEIKGGTFRGLRLTFSRE